MLSAAIVLSANWVPPDLVPLLLAVPGTVMLVLACQEVGLRNISIHPKPNQSAALVVTGIYSMIRHPMYSGQLLFTLAFLASGFHWWRLIAWGALLAVLVTKTSLEEQYLTEKFPEYREYQAKTSRLIPGIW